METMRLEPNQICYALAKLHESGVNFQPVTTPTGSAHWELVRGEYSWWIFDNGIISLSTAGRFVRLPYGQRDVDAFVHDVLDREKLTVEDHNAYCEATRGVRA